MGIPVTICQYNIVRENPLEKLSASLIVINEQACDGDYLNLVCQDGTKISIQSVFYGIQSKGQSHCWGNEIEVREDCSVQSAVGVVEKHCQGKTECSVQVSPDNLQGQDRTCLTNR